jgi:uncharacterized protein
MTLKLIRSLLPTLPDGKVLDVVIGLFWAAVVAEVDGVRRCGLSATLTNPEFENSRKPAIREAGGLQYKTALELVRLFDSESCTESSVGLAALNALLPPRPDLWVTLNGEDYIAGQGSDKSVAVVGHFPFIDDLRSKMRQLWVLELNPRAGDLPAEAAPEIIPQADIVAITATTLINHTFEGLLALCRPDARVLLLGPSTPLSPILFEHGLDVLSGAVVEDIDAILALIRQGATFKQMRPHGVRLVTMEKR